MTPDALGARVRQLREERGWTQDELARRAGIVQMTVSKVERGVLKRPSHDTLSGIAGALGVSTDSLTATPSMASTATEAAPEQTDVSALEEAVWRAIDPTKHTRAEADAAQRLSVESRHYLKPDVDVADLARRIVAATHALHKEGLPLTSVGIWTRVETAGSLGAVEARVASTGRLNAEADQVLEDAGITPEQREAAAARMKTRLAEASKKGGRR